MARNTMQFPPDGWLVAQMDEPQIRRMQGANCPRGGSWIVLHFDMSLRAWVFAAGAFAARWYAVKRARQLEARRQAWLWDEIDRRVTKLGAAP